VSFPVFVASVCRRIATEVMLPFLIAQTMRRSPRHQQAVRHLKQGGDQGKALVAHAVAESVQPQYEIFTDFLDVVRDLG
jgi:hypothetical protein